MNLGQLIGELMSKADSAPVAPAPAEVKKPKQLPLKETGVVGAIRKALRGRTVAIEAAEIAKHARLTALQVQTNIGTMRDVERVRVVSNEGVRKPFRYRLQGAQCDSAESA